MYHLTVDHSVVSMPRLLSHTGHYPRTARQFAGWSRALLILCGMLLIQSLTTRLQSEQTRMIFSHGTTTVPASPITATPPAAKEKFSFEYDGLLQFRISILQDEDGSLPVINISTSLRQNK